MKRLGWKKDKFDKRDFIHKISAVKVPAVFVLPNVPPVRDQGAVGSCVGFGIGANITGWAMAQKVYTEWFSPNWIYNGARFIEGSLKQDAGAYPKDALDWLVTKGCLLEHFWPYNPNKLDPTSPPSKFNSEAAKFPVISYYRITGGATAICDAIANGYYVSIGTPWFNKWMNPPVTGILSTVSKSDGIAGGHETCLYGYDQNKQLFNGMNSWSSDWGNQGHYQMPFQAFNIFGNFGGYDAHYVTVKWGELESSSFSSSSSTTPAPVPPPTPPPTPTDTYRIQVSQSKNGGPWQVLSVVDVK